MEPGSGAAQRTRPPAAGFTAASGRAAEPAAAKQWEAARREDRTAGQPSQTASRAAGSDQPTRSRIVAEFEARRGLVILDKEGMAGLDSSHYDCPRSLLATSPPSVSLSAWGARPSPPSLPPAPSPTSLWPAPRPWSSAPRDQTPSAKKGGHEVVDVRTEQEREEEEESPPARPAPPAFYFGLTPREYSDSQPASLSTAVGKVRHNETLSQPFRHQPRHELRNKQSNKVPSKLSQPSEPDIVIVNRVKSNINNNNNNNKNNKNNMF